MSIMLKDSFVGMAPEIISRCDCDSPNGHIDLVYDVPGNHEETRTFTASCPYCGAKETFTYESNGFDRWRMIDD